MASTAKKRKGKAAKAAELERVKGVVLVQNFSALKTLRNDQVTLRLTQTQPGTSFTIGNLALAALRSAQDLEAGREGVFGQEDYRYALWASPCLAASNLEEVWCKGE